jgi:hypothetical protein
MKRTIPFVVCVMLGVGIGWYFGYTRPVAKHQRQLLKEYREVRDNFHMTDEEMADAGRKMPQYFEDMKRQDEMAAAVALGALKLLEKDDVNGAKEVLARHVGSYYRLYHAKGGDAKMLSAIEEAAQQNPAISAEISEKDE